MVPYLPYQQYCPPADRGTNCHLPRPFHLDKTYSNSAPNNPSGALTGKPNRTFDSSISQICPHLILQSINPICLAAHLPVWTSITTNSWVFSIVTVHYAVKFLFMSSPGPIKITTPSPMLEEEIEFLLRKYAIARVTPPGDSLGFYSCPQER